MDLKDLIEKYENRIIELSKKESSNYTCGYVDCLQKVIFDLEMFIMEDKMDDLDSKLDFILGKED